jgi:hypothetical protein
MDPAVVYRQIFAIELYPKPDKMNPNTRKIFFQTPSERGPGSSVSIATGYGLDGQGIKSRWG